MAAPKVRILGPDGVVQVWRDGEWQDAEVEYVDAFGDIPEAFAAFGERPY